MPNEWLTLPEAAERLGNSARTIRRWIHSGKLSAELRPGPYGPQYYISAEVVDAVRARVRRPRQGREEIEEVVRLLLEPLDKRLMEIHSTLDQRAERLEQQLQAIVEEQRIQIASRDEWVELLRQLQQLHRDFIAWREPAALDQRADGDHRAAPQTQHRP